MSSEYVMKMRLQEIWLKKCVLIVPHGTSNLLLAEFEGRNVKFLNASMYGPSEKQERHKLKWEKKTSWLN